MNLALLLYEKFMDISKKYSKSKKETTQIYANMYEHIYDVIVHLPYKLYDHYYIANIIYANHPSIYGEVCCNHYTSYYQAVLYRLKKMAQKNIIKANHNNKQFSPLEP